MRVTESLIVSVVKQANLAWKASLISCCMVALAACVSNRPEYVAAAETGDNGYTSQKLTDNQYRVSFAGSSGTPVTKVQDYALLRAAELTIENNYDVFSIENQTVTPQHIVEEDPAVVVSPQVHTSCGLVGCTSTPYMPSYAIADANFPDQRQQFVSTLVIVMLEESESDQVDTYNAREVIRSIRKSMES